MLLPEFKSPVGKQHVLSFMSQTIDHIFFGY
jgi:hypothetical protein